MLPDSYHGLNSVRDDLLLLLLLILLLFWWVKKGKAVPLQAWSGPEGSRKLRFPDFIAAAQNAPAAFTPRKYTWYSFLLEAESTSGP
jgi:hypothetical protein